jgi:hypothetical protein
MIIGFFDKKELKVYADYYFNDNGLDVARQLGYFDFLNNWQKVSTNADLESVFNNVTLESLNIEDLNYFTPPSLSPYAVEIPEIYQWAFPENKFVLSGFEIPLDTYQSIRVVNLAYFQWLEFRAELDSGNYESLKRSLMPLWDYVTLQVSNNNIIVL